MGVRVPPRAPVSPCFFKRRILWSGLLPPPALRIYSRNLAVTLGLVGEFRLVIVFFAAQYVVVARDPALVGRQREGNGHVFIWVGKGMKFCAVERCLAGKDTTD